MCQNVSKEVLLTGRRIQAKIPNHSGDCVLREGQLYALPLMAKNSRIFSIALAWYYARGFIFGSLWQFITKCDRYYYKIRQLFYYKMRHVFYQKMRQFYHKMRQLLQITTILLQNATFITNCDSAVSFKSFDFKSKQHQGTLLKLC